MIVTTALAAAAATALPALRAPLAAYVAVVAFTRVLFGAHFPLDVIVGTLIGLQSGRFSAALVTSIGLLPGGSPRPLVAATAPPPEPAVTTAGSR